MKPICVKCKRFFRQKKSGIQFVESMPLPGDHHAAPGNLEPARWTPYKIWSGDLWECPGCDAEIVSGTGREPISEHYMDGFGEELARTSGVVVNDC